MEHPDKGSTDEAIGRPKQWREGRYEKAGEPIGPSVLPTPDDNADTNDR